MNRAVNAVIADHTPERFAVPWLMGDAAASQAESAQALGMPGGAFNPNSAIAT